MNSIQSAQRRLHLFMTDLTPLAELCQDALLTATPQGITYANAAALALLGNPATRPTLRGLRLDDLLHPPGLHDSPLWSNGTRLGPLKMVAASATGEGGSDAPLELTATRTAAAPGGEIAIRLRPWPLLAADAALERLRDAMNLSTDPVFLMDAQELTALDLNPAACAAMGLTREAFLSRPGLMALRRLDGQTEPDYPSLYAQVIARAPQALTDDYEVTTATGAILKVAITRHAVRAGERWLIFVTWRDISARVAAQTRLERLSAALDAAGDAIYVIDPTNFSYVDVNEAAARMHGVSRDTLRRMGSVAAFPGVLSDDERRQRYDHLITRHPETLTEERRVKRADGSVVWVESVLRAVRLKDEWLMVSVMRDITDRRMAQERLQLLKAAIDAATDGIAVVDPQTLTYIHVNDALGRHHGLTRDEMMAGGVLRAYEGTRSADTTRQLYQQIVDAYPQALIEERHGVRPDGSPYFAEALRSAVKVDDRWLIVGIIRDVTERRTQQDRLAQFKAAFDQSGDAIAIVDVASMRYIYVNEANLHLFPISLEEMYALGPSGVAQRFGDVTDLAAVYADLVRQHPRPTVWERDFVGANGQRTYMELRQHALYSGGRWLVISTKVDITARKQQQARMERFAAVVNLSADAVFLVDRASMKILDVNDATACMYGYSRTQMIGMPVHQVTQTYLSAPEEMEAKYDAVIAMSPGVMRVEVLSRRSDGSAFTTETHRQAIQSEGAWIIVVSERDITERKAAEARANRLRAAIDFAPDAIYLIDPEALEYVDMNQAAGRAYGMTREQVAEMGMLPFLASLGRMDDTHTPQTMREDYADLIARHPEVDVRQRRIVLPGRPAIDMETVRRAVNVDGRWLVLSAMRDITERKREQARMERFAAVVNLSADALFLIDRASMKILDVNDAAGPLYGYTREELVGMPVHLTSQTYESAADEMAALYDKVIAMSPAVMRLEMVDRRADGSTFPAEAQRQAIQSDGAWIIVVTVRDITQRKAAEARANRLSAAIDFAPDAIFLVDPESLEYIDMNQAAARIYGRTREELMEMGMLPFLASLGSVSFERTPEVFRRDYSRLIRTAPEVDVRELAVTMPGHAPIIVESLRRAVEVDGQWLILNVSRDITERKREQARTERFAAVVNLSADGVFIVDRDSMTVLDANEAAGQMYGYNREALIGMPVHELTKADPASGAKRAAQYDEVIAVSPQVVHLEFEVQRSDGTRFPAETDRQAIKSDGAWIIIITVRDISVRKAAQARIERFAAIVNLSSDAVLVHDPQRLALVDVNDAACRIYGYSREELLSLPPTMNRPDQSMDDMKQVYEATIAAAPRAVRAEFSTVRSNGEIFPAEAYRQAIKSEDGWLVVVNIRDISERNAAQVRIERFAAVVNQSSDAIFLIDYETNRNIDVNLAATNMYGYSRDELLTMQPHQLTAAFPTADVLARHYDDIVAMAPQVLTAEIDALRRDGSTFPAEVKRQALQSGGRWIIVATLRDISERKAAQARLELLSQAINAAPDAIVVLDIETLTYIDVNDAAAQIAGMTREQMMAGGLRAVIGASENDIGERKRAYAQVVARAPEPVIEEHAVRRNDGTPGIREYTRRAVCIDGRWLIVSVYRDITERRAAQTRLEMLRQAMNAAPDAIVVVDSQSFEYVDVNDAAAQMAGLTRDEMMAAGVRGVLGASAEQDAQRTRTYAETIAQAPKAIVEERAVRRSDGTDGFTEFTRRAVKIDGRWLIVSVNRDITERRAAQVRLELQKAAIDAAPDAIVILDPATLTYVEVNEAACRLHGVTREKFMTSNVMQIYPGMFTPASLHQRYDELIAHYPQVVSQERLLPRSDGTNVMTETARRAVRFGDRWLIISVIRDITQRKQEQARVERFAAVVNLSADAVFLVDRASMRIIDANPAASRMYGRSRDELLALSPHLNRLNSSLQEIADHYDSVIAQSPDVMSSEIVAVRADGSQFPAEAHRLAIQVDGAWTIIVSVRDISERKASEEEIRQRVAELTRSNQELEQFAYVTSHDLSEPLRMVASYTQLLAKRYADKFDDDGREFIGYAVNGAQRMKQLIDDLLMYSRAGRSSVQMRNVRLDKALDDALANLANAIERNGAVIERTPLPELVSEKAGLTQVFQNLVGNAIKFRGEAAPVVRISAVEDAHFWTITVADNGIGISPEYYQRIFVIFQRLHARTKYEGTGIGLSICKKIVERHGGQINVVSEPGQGTSFTFTLSKTLTESESK